ncbi:methyltransferase [Gordonia sp. TBRC 11910]|uniref:Methyltransferase n=1 Tax=Gordonia asplenii TaxID=2725283 RepID=A0A848L2Y9_9ACTN|nr:methyltransferase [Gordonia asplenii]NMO04802.1 methyltransferase [Gordonia asplenii]
MVTATGNVVAVDLRTLRRHPDVEGPGLSAYDAADRLILDEAASSISAAPAGTTVVIDDSYGALALSVVDAGGSDVRVHQDLVTGERALSENAARLDLGGAARSGPLTPELVDGATVVLLRLPRSLGRLDEVAGLIGRYADPAVHVFAGGRIKHMSPAMNDVLRTYFSRVDVSHARQKSRVLTATGPLPGVESRWPQRAPHSDLGLTLVAHGGVFAGTKVDVGTRFLLEQLDAAVPSASGAVDLACGNGIVGAWLAMRRPTILVSACDRSAAAVASARLTATANGVGGRVDVVQADGLEHLDDASAELIVLNPPFHADAALSTGIATHLFADAARVLAPGGELWCVWNSHLRYRGALERIVGPTRQIARNPKFTVTASRRV